MSIFSRRLLATSLTLAMAGMASAQATVDADSAKALFKENDCTKCHALDKTKKGPSLKKIAASQKTDGQEKIIKNMTTGPKIQFEDGSVEKHKIIDTKDPKELKNLADWILSQ